MEMFLSTFPCYSWFSCILLSHSLLSCLLCVWCICVVHWFTCTGARTDYMPSSFTIYLIGWSGRLFLNWKLSILARLTNQWTLKICLCLISQCWAYRDMQSNLAFNMDAGNWNSSSQVSRMSLLAHSPDPFVFTFMVF